MEENVRYNIRCVFTRGSDEYLVQINGKTVSQNSKFVAPVYTINSISIKVSELAAQPVGNHQATIQDPYIKIDNLGVYTKGRYYPQKFSAQAPGVLPEIDIPEEIKRRHSTLCEYYKNRNVICSHSQR